MKTTTIVLATALIGAAALNVPAQRTGRRSSGSTTSGSTTESQRTKPTGSNMSADQQQNIKRLQSDLSAIKSGSQVTTEQKQALQQDLMAMAEGATKPNAALVEQLANDLAAAMSDGNISNKELIKLTDDLEAVMNSANISKAQVTQAVTDAQAILKASGVSQSDAQAVVNDLNAIVVEAQKNGQNAVNEAKTNPQNPAGASGKKPLTGRRP